MGIEIQFDEYELNNNTKLILQASTTEEAQLVHESYKIIIQSINLFIQQYNDAYKQINIFQNGLKDIIKKWHKVKAILKRRDENYKQSFQYKEYLDQRQNFIISNFTDNLKQTFLNLYFLAFKIQELLNAALGQQVVTAYVFQTKGQIAPQVILSNNMKDFLKVEVNSAGSLVLRYRENQQNLKNHIENLQQSIKFDENDNNYNKLVKTYNKVHTRYKNHPLKRKRGSYVLWLYPYGGQKWNGAYISSFGSVNEAYTYFLLDLRQFNPNDIEEDDMEIFMNYVLTNVTNESGLLTGDFQNHSMEVAVKSADASALGLKQIYNLAVQLKKQKIDNFQGIVNFLQQQKIKNQNKAKPINTSLKESLQYIVDTNLGDVIKEFQQIKI